MKHKIFAVVILALPLAACGAGSVVDTAFRAVTTTIANPVTPVDIYRVKNAYAAADQLVIDYRSYCWGRSYVALTADQVAKPICQNRRAVVRAAQSYRQKAASAIARADTFIRNSPTLNAATVINAAWAAVTDFQNSVPKVN